MKKCSLYLIFILLGSCNHSGLKFQKGNILDVTMDPNKTNSASKSMHLEPASSYEKGASQVGGSYGSSCPTCG